MFTLSAIILFGTLVTFNVYESNFSKKERFCIKYSFTKISVKYSESIDAYVAFLKFKHYHFKIEYTTLSQLLLMEFNYWSLNNLYRLFTDSTSYKNIFKQMYIDSIIFDEFIKNVNWKQFFSSKKVPWNVLVL